MNFLLEFGWNNFHEKDFNQSDKKEFHVGRVISIQGFKYELITEKGELETELSGKLLYSSVSEELPKVGDWVRYLDYDQLGYIIDVLPRKNALSRKTPGTKTERQILATNIDCALVVQGLDRDFNVMRLDRYLVQLAACNIPAVVVLNKADLVDDVVPFENEIMKLQRGCEVYFCSTYNALGIDKLKTQLLKPGQTYILIGSSGVGKSSLLNSLVQSETQKISATSEWSSKGKHTTTSRDLFKLSNGSLVIDTPGMREFGVTFEEGTSSNEMFPAIAKFASNCRYADCRHIKEMGCAVIDALSSGQLDQEVYDSYIKLLKEQRRFEISAEDKKREGKEAGRMSREARNHRKKFKY
jgi:ribosome biogenesis GTPase / thiamine phosphate phosphatase